MRPDGMLVKAGDADDRLGDRAVHNGVCSSDYLPRRASHETFAEDALQ